MYYCAFSSAFMTHILSAFSTGSIRSMNYQFSVSVSCIHFFEKKNSLYEHETNKYIGNLDAVYYVHAYAF